MHQVFGKWSLLLLLFVVIFGGFLRFYKFTQVPPGLYADEVSIGVNAYDILTTGKDQYGIFFPLAFKATGEYKMPVYIYLTSVAMAVFGKNEFAIRFFSAVSGTATVVVVFFLCKTLLFSDKKTQTYATLLSLFTAFVFAISPWVLQFSRAGFEATVALFFYTASLLVFFLFLNKKKSFLLLVAGIFLALSFYTYDGYKLLVPMTTVVGFFIGNKRQAIRKSTYTAALIFFLLCLPMFLFAITNNGFVRFQQTSAFSQVTIKNPWERYFGDGVLFIKNYVAYFSVTYLFRYGDQITRHHVEGFGLLYLWELPYLFLGLYALFRSSSKALRMLLLFLLLAGPLLPATTVPSPHALRFLYGSIPLTILTGLGFFQLLVQNKKLMMSALTLTAFLMVVELVYYMHYYYVHYPKNSLIDWGGACKEVAMKLIKEAPSYEKIMIDGSVSCSQDYFSFYAPHTQIQYIQIIPSQNFHARTLVITSGKKTIGLPVDTVYLPNLNHDVFAKFYQL